MNKKSIVAIVIVFMAFMVSDAMAGPFGLRKGMSLKEIGGKPERIGNGIYKLIKVPKPHSAFEAYIVKVAPKGGLCWIKAIGKDIATSSYGIELKSAFQEMEKKLTAIYGEHETIDDLLPNSIWNEPSDWMMGLIKKERILIAIWDSEKGSHLPSDLKQVGLIAGATSGNTGYIAVEYSFTNKDSCDAELAKQEDDAL
ncbi:conserved hypothetical protein [Deferribacter desulfuricans SSM1]|uniref:Uncharacterized protein n=1 Tax=Deferribacter desulfuricans (strain DSM 14783 / JCM 11476 / NBRC 101012 / SSM1) TaxID=639282 RepID=D3PCN1_DEFDS|nr:hypothetical protein [Deferribacter desulfuricans]BAI80354.1 conserved hypothetical protein [Deferribacter desulfuricans SSM1]